MGWNAEAFRHLSPTYTVGLVTTFFTFQKDLSDGYFDPDFFGLAEIEGRGLWRFGRHLALQLTAGPGLQQVGGSGSVQLTIRGQTRFTYSVLPGREIRVDAGVSSAGVRSFATGDSDYRYGSVGISVGWVF